MAINYKNQGYDLITTSSTTVLTISTSTVAIIKEISVTNDDNSAHEVDYFFYDISASTSYKFYHTSVPADSHDNAVHNALVLEEQDTVARIAAIISPKSVALPVDAIVT